MRDPAIAGSPFPILSKLQQTQHIKTTLERFPIGQPVRLQSEQDGAVYYGVVEQVTRKSAEGVNPVNPSAWKLQIQVADSMCKLRMPLSKINTAAPTGIVLVAQATTSFGDWDIYSLFDERQTLAREQRQIFTGNVIRAFSNNKGKLINFTDHQGQVRQGLLMAKEFDITENLEQQPVRMPDGNRALEFLKLNGQEGPTRLKSKDENLVVHWGHEQLFLNTPRTKATGGRYYLDEDLLEAAQAEFVSTGQTMKLRVAAEKISAVLDYLYQNGKPLYAFEQRGLARQMLGVETPRLVEVEDASEASPANFGPSESAVIRQSVPTVQSTFQPIEVQVGDTSPETSASSPEPANYSPTLQEMRDWLQDARINGRSQRYIERIIELSVEFLAGSAQEHLSPAQREPGFRNSAFSLSDAGKSAMRCDRTLSSQTRSPTRQQLLTWYSAAKQLGQSTEELNHITALGQQQIMGTTEAQKPASERDSNFVNPNFLLSRQDYILFQKTLKKIQQVFPSNFAEQSTKTKLQIEAA